MPSAISLQNVTKRYHGTTLFSDVTFSIEEGATYALRGANGSGKSVLMRLMCRISLPDTGSVAIDERYMTRGRAYPDKFGITIDGPAYVAHASGYDNLLDLARINRRVGKLDVAETMTSFGLDPENRKAVRKYSTGMKQKLALCQATMEDQDVLILDEPFNGLDAASTDSLIARLVEFKQRGKTIVLTSHESSHLAAVADKTLTIENESVVLTDGSPAR